MSNNRAENTEKSVKKKSRRKKQTNTNREIKLLKPFLIVVGVFLAIFIFLMTWAGGWTSYQKNSLKFKDAVGTWELNSILVNTHEITYDATELTITKDGTATLTVTTQTDEEDESTAETQTSSYTIVAGSGTMDFTSEDGTVTSYEFSVDEDAGVLHLWATIDDKIYHYFYDIEQ